MDGGGGIWAGFVTSNVAVNVVPEIENAPIGRRRRWQTRTRDQVVKELRAESGVRA